MRKLTQTLALLVLTLSLLLGGCAQPAPSPSGSQSGSTSTASETAASLDDIPAFSGEPYVVIDDNQPSFTASELTTSSFESYAPIDSLGRCHLIGWQLTAENANRSNLITGTRYMNVDGMLPFENMVADYIKETGSHVMYRVTPVFSGDDLVAQGVQMEAYSVEDDGDGICFNVFCYNVQPGVTIDYADGTNHLSDKDAQTDSSSTSTDTASAHYVLNTSSKKYHDPSCSAVGKMSEKNRRDFTGTQAELEKEGYTPHTSCIK